MKHINKIIVILGQTSTGKSDFAVEIAKEVGAEIISADSRQVYKGMDLGTGKITPDTKAKLGTGQAKKKYVFKHKGIPHYLLDVASPKKTFSVIEYQKLANKKIKEISKKGKVPIICGGTGFYIDAIVDGTVFPEVKPNIKLRKELDKKSVIELFKILKKLDPDRAESIDKNNKVRLVRAIEIAKELGAVPKLKINKNENFEVMKIGLAMPADILKEKIRARLLSRIRKGMIKEVENLHNKEKVSWKRMYDLGLEYRYVALYLQGQMTKEEMIEKLNTEIWHFAKRQVTWFKRDKSTLWVNPLEIYEKARALIKIKEFLK